jgi:IS5 family transposase
LAGEIGVSLFLLLKEKRPDAKIEFFIKCQWNYRKTRYRGLAKNTGQLHLLFGLYNLFRVRKKLLLNPG